MHPQKTGWRIAVVHLVLGLVLFAVAPAQAQDVNDNFANAVPLVLGQSEEGYDTTDATTQAGEYFTPSSAPGPFATSAAVKLHRRTSHSGGSS